MDKWVQHHKQSMEPGYLKD